MSNKTGDLPDIINLCSSSSDDEIDVGAIGAASRNRQPSDAAGDLDALPTIALGCGSNCKSSLLSRSEGGAAAVMPGRF